MLSKKAIVALIGVGAVGTTLIANLGGPAVPQARAAAPVAPTVAPSARPQVSPLGVQQGLGALVAAVRPAVVSISAHPEAVPRRPTPGMQLLEPFPGRGGWVGSGVIVDPAGYVLTNRQVTGEVDVARVTIFRGGQNTFLARVVAHDKRSDLVLLKLPFGGDLPYAPIGDSSRVRTGDLVVAVGSPFGLAETVTQGIVSASRRSVWVGGRRYDDLIQTDASINQGNCGGPLINIRAEVVGINLAIYSTDSSFAGIGFAVASNQARPLAATVQRGLR